ncbi:hypothetical protein, partial [Klebsiella pneumoniae]|uniref:hypothetical protein n=1 Tax=Klebsiella pneumoniae TaxID=573 RepID=UPI002553EAD5
ISAILLGSAAHADAWRHDEFLKLDLSQAVLSSKMLGPPTQFEAAPVEDKAKIEPEPVKANAIAAVPKARAARASVRPKLAQRSRVAGPRRNPLDAQASDTRIQVWPCRSGALCNWKR